MKIGLRIGGVVVAACGLALWPLGVGLSPKRDLSFFSNLVDLGVFAKQAVAGFVLGILLVFVSYVLPGDEDDL